MDKDSPPDELDRIESMLHNDDFIKKNFMRIQQSIREAKPIMIVAQQIALNQIQKEGKKRRDGGESEASS